MVILPPFFRIELSSVFQILILRMIEDQIFCTKIFSILAGLLHRSMVLLIRLVDFPVPIEAEGLMQQPVRIFCIRLFIFTIRFISKKSKFLSIFKLQVKPYCLALVDWISKNCTLYPRISRASPSFTG